MSTDEQIQAAYTAAVAEWERARAMIDKDGIVVADDKGRPVPHPALAVERSASAEMRAWMAEIRRIEAQRTTAATQPKKGW